MPLLQATQSVINLVEKLSNRPVRISENASISTLSKMITARGDAPMHFLEYQPRGSSPPDYFIAYQCGFVVRLFSAPPDKRFDVGSTPEGIRRMNLALLDPRIPKEVRGMSDYLLTGLVTQLLSYPVGLRVDNWLYDGYPELRPLQVAGAQIQLEQNVGAIKVSKSGMFPSKVVKANLTMSAAFALYWARRWQDDSIMVPWKAAGFHEGAKRLLEISDGISDDPGLDMELIDAWAYELGLKEWYGRKPYILNP